jgi:hypothetical protein
MSSEHAYQVEYENAVKEDWAMIAINSLMLVGCIGAFVYLVAYAVKQSAIRFYSRLIVAAAWLVIFYGL